MKKILALLLSLTMVVALVACGENSTPTPSDNSTSNEGTTEIVIGVMEDITGSTGQQGTGAQKGIEDMAAEINESGGIGGKIKIRLVEYDIKGDVTESINAYKRLCEQDKANVVIGPHISNIGIALAPLSDIYKVPIVGAYVDDSCVLNDAGEAYRYMYISQPSASQQATVIANFAMETLGAKNFAVLYNSGNSYAISHVTPFMEYVEAKGCKIVAAESFADSDTDYRTQLTKILSTKPDAIYFPNYPAQIPLCVQQSREVGLTCDILGGNGFIPNVYLAGEAAENNTYFPYNIAYDDDAILTYNNEFVAKHGFETNAQTYVAMDALSCIVAAVEKCNSINSEDLTDALSGIQVKGWMGNFTLSADTHMPVGLPMAILNVVDGKPCTVELCETIS